MGTRLYVASSWRNTRLDEVLAVLEDEGFDPYDFRHSDGFAWQDIWPGYTPGSLVPAEAFLEGLKHPLSERGFAGDMQAIVGAEACVLVLPCGRSAHSEFGWFCRAMGKYAIVLLDPPEVEPELMYKMADAVVTNMEGVVINLREWFPDEEEEQAS